MCLFMSLFYSFFTLGTPERVWYGCSVAAGAGSGRKVSGNHQDGLTLFRE